MTGYGRAQSIPPAYCEALGRQLLHAPAYQDVLL